VVSVRPLEDRDRPWARASLEETWGSVMVASRGRLQDASILAGFVAEDGGRPVGLATYRVDGDDCELVSINSARERRGAGAALLEAVAGAARAAGCSRVWLITTNDNLHAMRFYQRRGWDLVALHRDAMARSRELKPEIPERGEEGIPIRHELEFELRLA
jgi:GNAT superfamily N-acetyltransferase